MWRLIAASIAEALQKATPELLRFAAGKLATLTRGRVPASVEGILAAAKEYAQDNPVKASLVVAALMEVGIDISMDAVDRVFGNSGEDSPVSAVIQEIRKSQRKRLEQITGDGVAGSVYGKSVSDVAEDTALVTLAIERVRAGARLFGSVEAFRQAREVLLLTEEQDFDVYAQVVNAR